MSPQFLQIICIICLIKAPKGEKGGGWGWGGSVLLFCLPLHHQLLLSLDNNCPTTAHTLQANLIEGATYSLRAALHPPHTRTSAPLERSVCSGSTSSCSQYHRLSPLMKRSVLQKRKYKKLIWLMPDVRLAPHPVNIFLIITRCFWLHFNCGKCLRHLKYPKVICCCMSAALCNINSLVQCPETPICPETAVTIEQNIIWCFQQYPRFSHCSQSASLKCMTLPLSWYCVLPLYRHPEMFASAREEHSVSIQFDEAWKMANKEQGVYFTIYWQWSKILTFKFNKRMD